MKISFFNYLVGILFSLFCFGAVQAQTYVNGYTKSDGTYVNGYYKSDKNNTNHDNYSTKGNVNPYTGKQGTKARDYSVEAQNYGQGRDIQTGPRGGQYYVNDKGNKVYVPKR